MDEFYGWIDSGVIEYLGVVSDVRNAILDADIVVLPSYREGVPRTLMEAASMGKPIIATDVPGCREVVIKNHTGWLVDVKSIDSLEGALLASMNLSYEQRDQMGRNGREYMQERFDVSFVVNIYFSYLKANV
jgi:glycosyltransferase involved in cell wall biosynthesis